MNYRDLQNISYLSQHILTESAYEEHDAMNRWPYSSPYLQEERAPGVKPYKAGPTGADVRKDAAKAHKKHTTSGNQQGWKETKTKTENPLITVNPGNAEDAAKVLHRTRPRQHGPTGSSIRIMGPMGADATRVGSEVENIRRGGERNISRSRRLPDESKTKAKTPRLVKKDGKWVKIKEDFALWMDSLLDEGYDLSDYTYDEMYELYLDESQQLNEISPGLKRRAADASVEKVHNAQRDYRDSSIVVEPYMKKKLDRAVAQHKRLAKAAYPSKRKTGVSAESYDLYDLVLAHLIDEGYADTYESANAIMANMSEEWTDSIVEDIRGAITYNPNTPIGRIKRRIKGSTPEKREARTRAYQGNRSDAAERYGASQSNPYDDNRGDIPSLRGH